MNVKPLIVLVPYAAPAICNDPEPSPRPRAEWPAFMRCLFRRTFGLNGAWRTRGARPRPLVPRQFIGHFDSVSIGIAEVNPQRQSVIGDVVDLHVVVLEALICRLQLAEVIDHPGHVVQPDLPRLLQGRIGAELHQSDLMRHRFVGGQERGPAFGE
jgi:hypothetical protein